MFEAYLNADVIRTQARCEVLKGEIFRKATLFGIDPTPYFARVKELAETTTICWEGAFSRVLDELTADTTRQHEAQSAVAVAEALKDVQRHIGEIAKMAPEPKPPRTPLPQRSWQPWRKRH